MPVRVIHTADIHLGRRFPSLDSEAEKLRAADVVNVFNELADYVIKNKINILMIAGSLFDKMHPNRETVSTALSAFGRIHEAMPSTRIVLTPGQEELVAEKDGSSDCALSIFDHLSYVKVMGTTEDPEKVVFEFDGQKVMIASSQAAFFFSEAFSRRRIPLPRDAAGIFLMCAYSRRQGLINIEDELLRERVLDPLRDRGYQYAALGHKNKFQTLTAGDFTAIYPGSLERFNYELDRERKFFVQFEISGGKIQQLTPVRSSARPLEYVSLTFSAGDADIAKSLEDTLRRAKKEKALHIILNGQISLNEFNSFMKGETIKKLREQFAFAHVENRLALVDAGEEYRFDALRVNSPAQEFERYVEREIAAAQDRGDEVRLLKELLEMGVKEIEEGL
ncbi:MAG: exonuclease subunit SbcD [bacterium ADurb.Bin236]|nr:MAG: exonuclease subunit SbcD [bacterium ADurb.Bin236]HPN94889.1 hypothetical protein [bacterium]